MSAYCHLAGQYRRTSWTSLDDFGTNKSADLLLGDDEKSHPKPLQTKKITSAMAETYPTFLSDLYQRQGPTGNHRSSNRRPAPQQEARLHLRLHSSTNKGLLSAQLLELGSKIPPTLSCSLIGPYTGSVATIC